MYNFIKKIGEMKDYIIANWKQLLIVAAIGAGIVTILAISIGASV